mmetsp:Transcript_132389/g.264087  ORF Transcript_132389/g.264087 Transcript_132389/m.264087 type:complete len:83 (-) Transcript_132389:167-415(-)
MQIRPPTQAMAMTTMRQSPGNLYCIQNESMVSVRQKITQGKNNPKHIGTRFSLRLLSTNPAPLKRPAKSPPAPGRLLEPPPK